MTKKEFLFLYEKDLNGLCTPEEKERLDNYVDEIELAGGQWIEDIDQEIVRKRILSRLNESRNNTRSVKKMNIRTYLIRAAAVILVVLSVGIWRLRHNTISNENTQISRQQTIDKPGANKAYLTLSNGSKVLLDDSPADSLISQSGKKIAQASKGKIVYKFANLPNGANNNLETNTITTPRGKQYQLILNDGSSVWLNSGSSLKFPVQFSGAYRKVELTGEAYFEVAKNKEKPFIVQANGTEVKVLGTHFNINAYLDNSFVTTTLLEGSVSLRHGKNTSLLRPGQVGITTENQKSIAVKDADIESTMDWKSNYFVFHNENIVSIMKRVSRWYDVDLEFKDDVSDREFGGTVSRYKDITELLNNMQLTHAIHYKIEGRRVTIMK